MVENKAKYGGLQIGGPEPAVYRLLPASFIVDTGFYTNAVVTVALFTILAKEWSKLMDIFTEIDKSMNRTYGFPVNLRKKVIHTTTYFMVMAAVEHVLSLTYRVLDCNKLSNCTTSLYYQDNYSQIFDFANYSTVLAVLTQAIHFWCTFAWNYNNLFIMLMSTILAERFKQITGRLKYYEKFRFAGNFWSSIREDYDKLCFLCYQLDSTLSYIILSSYGTNLFFIIIQLYNSLMNNYRNATEKAYFFFSFGFLIFRTVAVSLYAAQINDASKEPTVILHSVPSIVYNEDIKRLLCQISFDSAVLTGCKMFKITRGLILNIAGAIVTYELVLIQFNAYT
ncbi:Trehalose receptor [Popillia japonica]|uniref:Trehalose receptor n=1 Tax=Popillia japonica TaxID=7064 RepID=A0AAW1L966_POPJA